MLSTFAVMVIRTHHITMSFKNSGWRSQILFHFFPKRKGKRIINHIVSAKGEGPSSSQRSKRLPEYLFRSLFWLGQRGESGFYSGGLWRYSRRLVDLTIPFSSQKWVISLELLVIWNVTHTSPLNLTRNFCQAAD